MSAVRIRHRPLSVDGPTLVSSATIPAAHSCNGGGPGSCWRPTRSGFRYADRAGYPDGIVSAKLREGREPGRAAIVMRGKGATVDMPVMPLDAPVRVQLKNSAGTCWEAEYGLPSRNAQDEFRAKSD